MHDNKQNSLYTNVPKTELQLHTTYSAHITIPTDARLFIP